MPQMVLDITPELQERISLWSSQVNEPPESLAVELLEEYFDDCDDADKLEALIKEGQIRTYSMDEVHRELAELDAVES